MTDDELRDLVAETSRVAAENSRAIREMREDSERRWEASQRQWQESREEILASRQETDRLITSLERRLGEIGNAFGLYTESMFRPSLRRILRERFGMTVIIAPQVFQLNGSEYEVLATIKDDVFELSTPDGFVPRAFGLDDLSPEA